MVRLTEPSSTSILGRIQGDKLLKVWINTMSHASTVQSWPLVFGGVNHPAHEQETVCVFMVYEEEKWSIDKEGPG